MELEDFLLRLLDFGCHADYFNFKSIGSIDKSCCPDATTVVIDFDKTKDKVCSEAKLQPYKSCDALKILPDLKRVDFIEFKGLKPFIRYVHSKIPPSLQEQKIDQQIEKFDLETKLHDSYIILYFVLTKNSSLKKTDKPCYRFVEKNYIILVDTAVEEEGIQNLALTLEFLSETSSPLEKQVATKLAVEINELSDLPFKLNKPMLKSCKTIDSFYESFPTASKMGI
ncbi:MAG: hypothetical protein VSS75_034165 [Candidatus Parabeggiatoa sp.]|nr:hypothetical protein [Candidatus Parabeggiatoa sp.]